MVTFSFTNSEGGHQEAKMFINPVVARDTALLQWTKHRFERVVDNKAALDFLANAWDCPQEQIRHNLPNEINTLAQELDFAMFYNGQSFMACDLNGKYRRQMWARWKCLSEARIESAWEYVATEMTFPDHPEYADAVIQRVTASEADLASTCQKSVRYNKPVVEVFFKRRCSACFPVCVGTWENTRFHVKYSILSKMTWEMIPLPSDIQQVIQITSEEKTKAVTRILSTTFPNDSDVAVIKDYPHSLLREVYPLPEIGSVKHDIFWVGPYGHMAYVVRIPPSGHIRCRDTHQRSRLIGRKAVKINELAIKHGFTIHLGVE